MAVQEIALNVVQQPPTKEQVLYHSLMEEIKGRVSSLNVAVTNQLPLPTPSVREFCFLQLRYICELIALGCLAAHGDIKDTHAAKCQDQYSADTILSMLERLHSDYYPYPCDLLGHKIELVNNGNALSKNELIKLYGQCGDVLHRGKMKKIKQPKVAPKHDFSDIVM